MKSVVILDGGMGRELKAMGAPFSQPLWSAQALAESPQDVKLAHQSFVRAGAEIIIANAYACVPFHLNNTAYENDGAKLAEHAAQIAREVSDNSPNRVLVAGVIPPAFGSYRPDLFVADKAMAIFTQLYHAQSQYIDLWIAETVASLKEFRVIHSVLQHSDKPCYYSFTLKDNPNADSVLRSGESVKDAVSEVIKGDGNAVMFNCSNPEVMASAIKQSKSVIKRFAVNIKIGVYANNFTPIEPDHEANASLAKERALTPGEYLQFAVQWYQLGADIIGGCCGIGPEHIAALSTWKTSEK